MFETSQDGKSFSSWKRHGVSYYIVLQRFCSIVCETMFKILFYEAECHEIKA